MSVLTSPSLKNEDLVCVRFYENEMGINSLYLLVCININSQHLLSIYCLKYFTVLLILITIWGQYNLYTHYMDGEPTVGRQLAALKCPPGWDASPGHVLVVLCYRPTSRRQFSTSLLSLPAGCSVGKSG